MDFLRVVGPERADHFGRPIGRFALEFGDRLAEVDWTSVVEVIFDFVVTRFEVRRIVNSGGFRHVQIIPRLKSFVKWQARLVGEQKAKVVASATESDDGRPWPDVPSVDRSLN